MRAGRVDLTKLHDALYSVENELNSLTLNGGKDKLLIFSVNKFRHYVMDRYGKVNGQMNYFCGCVAAWIYFNEIVD